MLNTLLVNVVHTKPLSPKPFQLEFGLDPTIYYPVDNPYNEESDVLLIGTSEPVSIENIEPLMFKWKPHFWLDKLKNLGEFDEKDTPWEHELKIKRMIRFVCYPSALSQS